MSRVDYEAAWTDFLELIASRDGWGSKSLMLEAARIAGRHRVEEGLLERSLRLYGGQITLAVSDHNTEAPATVLGGTSLTEAAPVPGHDQPEEGIDEHHRAASAAAAVG